MFEQPKFMLQSLIDGLVTGIKGPRNSPNVNRPQNKLFFGLNHKGDVSISLFF